MSSLKNPTQPYLFPGSGLALKLMRHETSQHENEEVHLIRGDLVMKLLEDHVYNAMHANTQVQLAGRLAGVNGVQTLREPLLQRYPKMWTMY